MTLAIDGTDIEYFYLDDVEYKQVYVDGVLVFTGPELGEVTEYSLDPDTLQSKPNHTKGYDFNEPINPNGDLIPKEFLGEFIELIENFEEFGNPANFNFKMRIDGNFVDLGQDFFWSFGILDLGFEILTKDAVFLFDGEKCTWEWNVNPGIGPNSFYDCIMYEREPFEFVEDFTLLPGQSNTGATIGYVTAKFDPDIFGDLNPRTFKSATWGAIIENVATGDVIIAFEDVNLAEDYWREMHFKDLNITLYAEFGTYATDTTGSYWAFSAVNLGLVTGLNYELRVKGKQETLYALPATLVAGENAGETGTFKGYSTITPAGSIGSYSDTNLKGHTITSVMDDTINRFVVTCGLTDLPQGYWHTCVIEPVGISFRSIDCLFNNVGDDPIIEPNSWVHPTLPGQFVDGQQYEITFYADNFFVPATLLEGFIYDSIVSQEDGVSSMGIEGQMFRDIPIVSLAVYDGVNVFALVLAGENKLQSYVKEIRIPELNYRVETSRMQFDRTTFPGQLVWLTYDNLPQIVDGQQYAVHLYS